MTQIDKRDDFKIQLSLKDDANNILDPSRMLFEFKFKTQGRYEYVVANYGVETMNAIISNSNIIALFDNHNLKEGQLNAICCYYLPDPEMPDKINTKVRNEIFNIELI